MKIMIVRCTVGNSSLDLRGVYSLMITVGEEIFNITMPWGDASVGGTGVSCHLVLGI